MEELLLGLGGDRSIPVIASGSAGVLEPTIYNFVNQFVFSIHGIQDSGRKLRKPHPDRGIGIILIRSRFAPHRASWESDAKKRFEDASQSEDNFSVLSTSTGFLLTSARPV